MQRNRLRSECADPCRNPGSYRIHHRPLPRLSGAPILHRFDRSFHGIAVMGSHTRVTGATVKGSNEQTAYRHWHTVCAACGRVARARPCKVPGDIDQQIWEPLRRMVAGSDIDLLGSMTAEIATICREIGTRPPGKSVPVVCGTASSLLSCPGHTHTHLQLLDTSVFGFESPGQSSSENRSRLQLLAPVTYPPSRISPIPFAGLGEAQSRRSTTCNWIDASSSYCSLLPAARIGEGPAYHRARPSPALGATCSLI
jgi:hypothetical protein